jgi:trehalose 6-phosphate phosphatase
MRSGRALVATNRLPLPPAGDRWAVFLDFDGTLVPIAATPRAVRWRPLMSDQLARLHRHLDGALAVISGRPADEVARLMSPSRVPIAGHHGLERRDVAGRLECRASGDPRLPAAARSLRAVADMHRGLEVEEKILSVAVHYRHAPHLAGLVRDRLDGLARDLGPSYELQTGKMVLELKPAGRDKGTAVAEFMADAPFRGRMPVFVGDDDTDEAGFRAVNALGGISVKVGSGPTAAGWRLSAVGQVWTWLAAISRELGRPGVRAF